MVVTVIATGFDTPGVQKPSFAPADSVAVAVPVKGMPEASPADEEDDQDFYDIMELFNKKNR